MAVIDGGIDADHEDLIDNMWINEDEIAGNGLDDDQNGYIDDIHGWNFIGGPDGENVDHDTFELTRIYRKLEPKYADIDTTQLSQKEREEYAYFREIHSDYEDRVMEQVTQYENIRSLEESMAQAKQILSDYYSDSTYTYEDLQELQPQNQQQQFAQNVMLYVMENDIDSTLIAEQKKQVYEFAKYGYNPDFHTRQIVGDNYEDTSERFYGNNDVAGPDPTHGTHVAGIIAAVRNNDIGINGVSNNTKIMGIRAVPNGDERDKDVANAIRYAVDNGAHVINMSFGKGYSPYKETVDAAVKYAEENGVLLVHGAGNDGADTDTKPSFPTDKYGDGFSDEGASELWISVGASSWKPNEDFVASFSNYGDESVDIFAPGVDIYSTMPDDSYEFQDGTSMASPVVAGVAALIMAYYPNLSARQVKDVILQSAVKYTDQQVVLPNQQSPDESMVPFGTLSVSGGVVNVERALQEAQRISQ
ncbi:S8 family peptidase [Halalkalibaculum roseum]|uniref:S8 family peptidase n=1 Tax=Halalkalibaculum roseum TaxID=2709311 RepID=UPI003D15FDB9